MRISFLTVFAIIGSGQVTVIYLAQIINYLTETKKQVAADINSASTFASTVDLIKKNHVNLGSATKLPMNHTPTEF